MYLVMFDPIEGLFAAFKTNVKQHLFGPDILDLPISPTITLHLCELLQDAPRVALSDIIATQCKNWDRHVFSLANAVINNGEE